MKTITKTIDKKMLILIDMKQTSKIHYVWKTDGRTTARGDDILEIYQCTFVVSAMKDEMENVILLDIRKTKDVEAKEVKEAIRQVTRRVGYKW